MPTHNKAGLIAYGYGRAPALRFDYARQEIYLAIGVFVGVVGSRNYFYNVYNIIMGAVYRNIISIQEESPIKVEPRPTSFSGAPYSANKWIADDLNLCLPLGEHGRGALQWSHARDQLAMTGKPDMPRSRAGTQMCQKVKQEPEFLL